MEGNEIAVGHSTWQEMKEQANVLVRSGFLPPSIKNGEQALSVALAGKELGIGFMESIRSINVIQGKPTVSPQLMLALANRTKELEDIEIKSTNDKTTVTVKRRGRKSHTNEFGIPEATELGLMGKDNYKKQPKTMFLWRALAANLRVTFPDAVSGLYTPEELGIPVRIGENDSMEVVEAETVTVEQIKQPMQEIKTETAPLQDDLVSEIKDMLGLMNNGDTALMEAQLMRLTSYKSKKTGSMESVRIAKLPEIAIKLPDWIKNIHAKVKSDFTTYSKAKQPA